MGERLCEVTEMDGLSFQSPSGASGEYIGLQAIRLFHENNGEGHRNVMLVPKNAHGTNPASASKIGYKIIPINIDGKGYIDIADLKAQIKKHKPNVAGLMMTYPSTHGVFEEHTLDILREVKEVGGQIYIDGANMNSQMFLSSPGFIGGDVCHLNLHKTFAIPHGGGGPGFGTLLAKRHLCEFLPSHCIIRNSGFADGKFMSPRGLQNFTAPFSSASILSISYIFIRGLGSEGLR